jgi:hypothetical protein
MRYPMSIEGIAQRHYQKLLALDDQLRMIDSRFASIGFDDVWIENLTEAFNGSVCRVGRQDCSGSGLPVLITWGDFFLYLF